MNAPTIGAIVGVAFGCAWGIAGATGLRPPRRAPSVVGSIVVSMALIAALVISGAKGPSGSFRGDVYGIAVALEVAGIAAAIWLLERLGLARWFFPTVGFIVGLHFLGLWQATDLPRFAWIAVAMCAVCAFAVILPSGGDTDVRRVVVGLGSAFVLWAAALAVL